MHLRGIGVCESFIKYMKGNTFNFKINKKMSVFVTRINTILPDVDYNKQSKFCQTCVLFQ